MGKDIGYWILYMDNIYEIMNIGALAISAGFPAGSSPLRQAHLSEMVEKAKNISKFIQMVQIHHYW